MLTVLSRLFSRSSFSQCLLTCALCMPLGLFSASAMAEDDVKPMQEQKTVKNINVNSADALTLSKSLKGVGIKKAEAIIRYREMNGSFTTLDDLSKVKGIGKSIINRNKVAIVF